MNYYAGIDVSLKESSVCVLDAKGKVIREAKVASEPEALIAWFAQLGLAMELIGLEAGPLSQWLFAAMKEAGLAVELLETRHVRNALKWRASSERPSISADCARAVPTRQRRVRALSRRVGTAPRRSFVCLSIAAFELRSRVRSLQAPPDPFRARSPLVPEGLYRRAHSGHIAH